MSHAGSLRFMAFLLILLLASSLPLDSSELPELLVRFFLPPFLIPLPCLGCTLGDLNVAFSSGPVSLLDELEDELLLLVSELLLR